MVQQKTVHTRMKRVSILSQASQASWTVEYGIPPSLSVSGFDVIAIKIQNAAYLGSGARRGNEVADWSWRR
jgi:hypothetical protein